MTAASETTIETLRHPAFSRFFAGITIANTGQFLQGLAVPFLVNDLTDSNAWVGAASFASLVPAVIATPVAGIVSDRADRKRILLYAYLVQCVVSVGFVVLYQADALTPWRILGLQFIAGICAGFQWAPIQSLSPTLVPPRLLVDAVRLVSISFTAGRAIGPAIAAVVLATAGPGLAFAGTLILYVVAVGFVATVKTDWVPSDATEPFVAQFTAGIRYVRQRAGMRVALASQAAVAFFGAVFTFALTASIADDAYDVGGGGLGALAMFAGLGAIIGSVFVTGRGATVPRSRLEPGALVLYGSGILLAAATPYLVVGLVGFTLLGIAHMVNAVAVSTSLQVQVDDEYRGRVMSVWIMVALIALPIASLAGGFLADALSIRIVMTIFGGALLAFVLVTGRIGDGFGPLDDVLEAEPAEV